MVRHQASAEWMSVDQAARARSPLSVDQAAQAWSPLSVDQAAQAWSLLSGSTFLPVGRQAACGRLSNCNRRAPQSGKGTGSKKDASHTLLTVCSSTGIHAASLRQFVQGSASSRIASCDAAIARQLSCASSRDIFGCSKNRQNRIVENSTYPLDDFGFR